MTCDEVRELLPGYALEALDPSERDAVDAHLMTCRLHDEDLVQLRTTGMALSVLDEASTPSAQLRARVLAEVGPSPLPPLAIPLRPARGALWQRAGIAAAIALVMFGAGWFAHARSAPAPQQAVRYSYAMRSPSGQLVQFTGVEGSERVTVTMDGIQAAPEGRQYQVWAIRNDKWVSLGACNTNANGWWRGDFQFKLQRGEEIALTLEPAGGSPKPSTPAILRTKL